MSDREQVLEANRAFYQAFESLEIERMESVWLQEPHIVCIHPGWRRLSGWGPIMSSWERIFESTFEINFELSEVDVMLRGDVAVVVVQENLTQRDYDGMARTSVMSTNVFERVGSRWCLVLHHGSPVAAPSEHEPPIQ
jgi:ketosteroid isomerase-like protein